MHVTVRESVMQGVSVFTTEHGALSTLELWHWGYTVMCYKHGV